MLPSGILSKFSLRVVSSPHSVLNISGLDHSLSVPAPQELCIQILYTVYLVRPGSFIVSPVAVCAVSVDGSSVVESSAYTYLTVVAPIGVLYVITAESPFTNVFTRSCGGMHAGAGCNFTESNQKYDEVFVANTSVSECNVSVVSVVYHLFEEDTLSQHLLECKYTFV